ncbi:ATP-binding protein [Henriciella marina]|uniref:ATP-binding protein n=1 Tax=Henriciella marina TaxID=453851 RepID=UPI00039D069D|nr:ATP-binding protein [Henriciella marina]
MGILGRIFGSARRADVGRADRADKGAAKSKQAVPVQLNDVFKPSALYVPYTYVSRPKAEKLVRDSLRYDNRIVHLHGPSKSGKTVLAKRFAGPLPRAHIHAYETMSQSEFWEKLRAAIQAPEQSLVGLAQENAGSDYSGRSAEFRAGTGQIGASYEAGSGHMTEQRQRHSITHVINTPGRVGVIEFLKANPHTIVIDDFHWLDRALLPDIFPPLKEALGEGCKMILLSVANEKLATTGDLADFAGRVIDTQMPSWEAEELQEIARLGFATLNVTASQDSIMQLARCAYFSPLLMQGLCSQYCYENEVEARLETPRRLPVLKRNDAGQLAGRHSVPLTRHLDQIIDNGGDRKWLTKDRDGRLLSMAEVFVLGISHIRPFEPLTLEALKRRIETKILHKGHMPENLSGVLASKAMEIQRKMGGKRGDRSPIYYSPEEKTVTIVDPYFKLWARWVRGKDLGGKLFIAKAES